MHAVAWRLTKCPIQLAICVGRNLGMECGLVTVTLICDLMPLPRAQCAQTLTLPHPATPSFPSPVHLTRNLPEHPQGQCCLFTQPPPIIADRSCRSGRDTSKGPAVRGPSWQHQPQHFESSIPQYAFCPTPSTRGAPGG